MSESKRTNGFEFGIKFNAKKEEGWLCSLFFFGLIHVKQMLSRDGMH
jgi:hypothetical protein